VLRVEGLGIGLMVKGLGSSSRVSRVEGLGIGFRVKGLMIEG